MSQLQSKSIATQASIDYLKVANELFDNQFGGESLEFDSPLVTDHDREEIIAKWIVPLIKLLINVLCDSNSYARIVYLGERSIRPFPSDTPLAIKKAYFNRILPQELSILNQHFHHLHPEYKDILRELHLSLVPIDTQSHVRVTTFGDCLMTQLNTTIVNSGRQCGIGIVNNECYIGAWGGDHNVVPSINEDHHLNIFALSLFTYWGHPLHRMLMKQLWDDSIEDSDAEKLVASLLEYIKTFIKKIRSNANAVIFLHNSSALPWLVNGVHLNYFPWLLDGEGNVERMEIFTGLINNAIDDFINEEPGVILIDEREIIEKSDRGYIYEDVFSDLSLDHPFFHYNNFGLQVANSYLDKIKHILSLSKKKIVFVDFDNTLWRGVMAEGSVHHFREKQKLISDLGAVGIILVALSKNSSENIRWSEMRIRQQEFACVKINWNSKISNIIEACKELNISLDQVVVIDDMQEELALINVHLPEVLTLDSREESCWAALKLMYSVNYAPSEKKINRNRLYRAAQQRKGVVENAPISSNVDTHALLSPLGINVSISLAGANEVDRIYELLHRTNQFNCSGKKYPKTFLYEAICSGKIHVYCFSLKDKFGDMGLVGVAILSRDAEFHLVENFVMSCRAMGYGLENLMLSFLLDLYRHKSLVGLLIPNSKNKPAQNLYMSFGFTEEQTYLWKAPVSIDSSLTPTWINVVRHTHYNDELAESSIID